MMQPYLGERHSKLRRALARDSRLQLVRQNRLAIGTRDLDGEILRLRRRVPLNDHLCRNLRRNRRVCLYSRIRLCRWHNTCEHGDEYRRDKRRDREVSFYVQCIRHSLSFSFLALFGAPCAVRYALSTARSPVTLHSSSVRSFTPEDAHVDSATT